MKIALIAPPFIPVPPKVYGGTELFIAHLAEGLGALGHSVVVYTNGESTVNAEKRWIYPESEWPLDNEIYDNLKDLNHTAWAIADGFKSCDIIHLNNAPGLVGSRFSPAPFIYTVHHPHVAGLSEFYGHYPEVQFVTISDFQKKKETMKKMRTIHHGIDLSLYDPAKYNQRTYFSFLGRIAPIKGTHLAIAVAKQTGIPLKIAGEVQPMFQEYFDTEIKPHLDGKSVEYVGEVNLEEKNELLGNSLALLFPIQWNEPFGLVMVEAMACGTPVLAFSGGAVPEVVKQGVSGYICDSVESMIECARNLDLKPASVRKYVEENFSVQTMVQRYAEMYSELLASPAEVVREQEPAA